VTNRDAGGSRLRWRQLVPAKSLVQKQPYVKDAAQRAQLATKP
jgi:hypothetical protein